MCKSALIVKQFCKNAVFHLIQTNIVLFSVLLAYKIVKTHAVPSGVHVDGYQEAEVPVYPFQQYIQVRKTYTVEHIPVYQQEPSSYNNLQASASNSHHGGSNDGQTASTSYSDEDGSDGGGEQNYYVPRLREEISDYKKQEVYEEKGYGDSAYDHHKYKEPTNYHHHNDHDGEGSSAPEIAESSSTSRNAYRNDYRQSRLPPRDSLHSHDGSSTKILEYVASRLHDHDAQAKGIYAARSNIYCPEVIDFDLSSKSMGMGKSSNRGSKPRLHGLGSKIECLKNKYFGREPLPKAIFSEPSESKESAIAVPSFNNFFRNMRDNVDSMSSFQNSRLPI